MKKTILIFTTIILMILLLFQLSHFSIKSVNIGLELVIVLITAFGIIIGVLLNRHSLKNKKPTSRKIDLEKVKQLELTDREYEVLQKISEGLSNKEIANKLYLSESTIKTHVSNLLVKLNAKRRTHALQIAKELQII